MDTESARALYCRALFLIKHTLNTLHDHHIIIISSTNQHITYLSSLILLFHTLCTYCVQLWLFTGPLCLWNTHTHPLVSATAPLFISPARYLRRRRRRHSPLPAGQVEFKAPRELCACVRAKPSSLYQLFYLFFLHTTRHELCCCFFADLRLTSRVTPNCCSRVVVVATTAVGLGG